MVLEEVLEANDMLVLEGSVYLYLREQLCSSSAFGQTRFGDQFGSILGLWRIEGCEFIAFGEPALEDG